MRAPAVVQRGASMRLVAPGVWVERASAASGVVVHTTDAAMLTNVAFALGSRARPRLAKTGIATTYFTAAKADRAIAMLQARALIVDQPHHILNKTENR